MREKTSFSSSVARSAGLRLVERAVTGLSRLTSAIGSLMIVISMFLIVADVFMRYVFNDPIEGVAEIVSASIVTIVFLQLPNTIRQKRMINSDVWLDRLQQSKPRFSMFVEAVYFFAGAFMIAVLVHSTLPKVVRAYTDDFTIGTPGIFVWPLWPFEFGVLVGAGLAVLVYLLMAVQHFFRAVAMKEEQAS